MLDGSRCRGSNVTVPGFHTWTDRLTFARMPTKLA
jgi:hypothetical protein